MDWTAIFTAVKPIAAQGARDGLRLIGMGLATHGFIQDGAGTEAFIGAGMTLAGLFWGWFTTSGYLQVGALLKKVTAQHTQANAVEAAKALPTGAAIDTSIKRTTVNAVTNLLLAFVLSALMVAPAMAAGKTNLGLPCDPANVLPGCKQPAAATGDSGQPSLMSLLSKPLQDLANFLQSDFEGAEDLSTAIPALQDGNGQACWSQMKSAGAVFKQHPLPLSLKAATDLEALRLLIITANNTCNNTACTQVFTEAGNLVQSIVSTAAGPLSVPLPNLTVLCSKLPPISVVAPTLPIATPTPTPTPTPSPSVSPTPSPSPTK